LSGLVLGGQRELGSKCSGGFVRAGERIKPIALEANKTRGPEYERLGVRTSTPLQQELTSNTQRKEKQSAKPLSEIPKRHINNLDPPRKLVGKGARKNSWEKYETGKKREGPQPDTRPIRRSGRNG